MTNDISKLPQWAQSIITGQMREIDTLRDKLEAHKFKPENGSFYFTMCGDLEKIYLPKEVMSLHCPVLEPKIKGDELIVTRQIEGHGDFVIRTRETSLLIEPQASNSINIFTRRR